MPRTAMQQFEYYLKNRTQILQKKKEYRQKNKQDIAKKKRVWDLQNKDKKAISDKKYRESKKQKLIEKGEYTPQRGKKIYVLKDCEFCSKRFVTEQKRLLDNRGRFCSDKCKYLSTEKIATKICEICGEKFSGVPSHIKRRKFCSEKCMGISLSSLVTRQCKICNKSFKIKLSRIQQGKGSTCSQKCAGLYKTKCAIDNFFKRVKFDYTQMKRRSVLDQNWATHIKKRDKKCQVCGKEVKDAHHILQRQFYPLLRFNENNGIGLCEICHHQVHGNKLLVQII